MTTMHRNSFPQSLGYNKFIQVFSTKLPTWFHQIFFSNSNNCFNFSSQPILKQSKSFLKVRMHTWSKAEPHLYQPLKKTTKFPFSKRKPEQNPTMYSHNRMSATQIPSFPFPCNLQLSRSYLCRWWKQSEIRLVPSMSPPLFLKVQVRDGRESVIINSFLDSE